MVSALLLNPSKNRLFLQCTNIVSLLQPRHSTGSPCTGWLVWALITALNGLSIYLGVISNSSEGRYDLMMTSGDMLITVGSGGNTCLQLHRMSEEFNFRSGFRQIQFIIRSWEFHIFSLKCFRFCPGSIYFKVLAFFMKWRLTVISHFPPSLRFYIFNNMSPCKLISSPITVKAFLADFSSYKTDIQNWILREICHKKRKCNLIIYKSYLHGTWRKYGAFPHVQIKLL